MSAYRSLSIAQFFFIFFCGISVLDFGVQFGLSERDEDDASYVASLGFNELLFDDANGSFWGLFQFWGYCMIIVAILQLLKALSVENF